MWRDALAAVWGADVKMERAGASSDRFAGAGGERGGCDGHRRIFFACASAVESAFDEHE
jgi:hypothetical protein